MFTQRSTSSAPRAGRPARSIMTTVGASAAICALTVGFVIAAPVAASATTLPVSYGEGQFLSGSLLGLDLDAIVELAPATASNNGSQVTQRSNDPLSPTLLNSIGFESPRGIQLNLGDVLDAGVLHQFAQAAKDGSSVASAGAVTNDGGIGVGESSTGVASDLALDLDALLDSRYASILTDLDLSLEAVSANASASLDSASGDYTLAGATLTFTSPAIAQLSPKVHSALAPVDDAIASLGGDDGVLGNAVDGVIDPVLGVVGSSANVTATVTSDVRGAVAPLLTGEYGDGAVRFNLQTGQVSVDLEQLLGGDLNNLAPGTELLTGPVVNQILKGITDTVSTLSDQIIQKVDVALDGAQVDVHADLDLLSSQGSQDNRVCRDIQVPIIGDIITPLTGGLLGGSSGGGLLGGMLGAGHANSGGTTQGVIGHTTDTVCEVVGSVLPDLRSTVDVDVQGTVRQILDGTAATGTASVSLLGGTVDASLTVDSVIGGIAAGLTDSLFDSDGAVAQVTDRLNSGLVNPAVDGLLGSTSVGSVLDDVLSVRANVQKVSDGTFIQTAVRVTVLKDAGSSGLATIDLAKATVGPNVTRVIDPCVGDCGSGNPDPDPTCTTDCPTGGNPGTTTPGDSAGSGTSATNRLAYTGAGIASLIAVILALLGAGVYLARMGHRRSLARAIATD
ncbi:choice-of-anchor G family protein [Salinibacterium sp. CAN_S4]|uniref:choice-of-anchor G family protein n=1 Tax=Salinibacterium sp. CAN_S4 TaxID=2787727 RepID=UPI0018EF40C4